MFVIERLARAVRESAPVAFAERTVHNARVDLAIDKPLTPTWPTHLIVLCGGAGVGKDTVADYITRTYTRRQRWARVSFAGRLKTMCAVLVAPHWSRAFLNGEEDRAARETRVHPVLGITARRLLQLAGDEGMRRGVDERIWLKLAMQDVADAASRGATGVIITDGRYENELEEVRARGGVVWCVAGPHRGVAAAARAHASETAPAAALVDRTLPNHGSFEELWAVVDGAMKDLST